MTTKKKSRTQTSPVGTGLRYHYEIGGTATDPTSKNKTLFPVDTKPPSSLWLLSACLESSVGVQCIFTPALL